MAQLTGGEAIVLMEAEAAIKGMPSSPVEDLLREAMKATANHRMVLDEDVQFRMAVGAVLLAVSEEDRAILRSELNGLRALNAAISGVPVDFGQIDIPENCYGLMKIWHEVRGKK